MRYLAIVGEREIPVEVIRRGPGRYSVRIDGRERQVESRGRGASKVLTVDDQDFETTVVQEGGAGRGRSAAPQTVHVGGRTYPVRLEDPLRRGERAGALHQEGRIDVCSIMPGRVTALLGPNAAGKSTLLRCAIGAAPLGAGEALLDGIPARRLHGRELARRLAYVPQRPTVAAAFTVREVVELGRFALGPAPGRVAAGATLRVCSGRALMPLDQR